MPVGEEGMKAISFFMIKNLNFVVNLSVVDDGQCEILARLKTPEEWSSAIDMNLRSLFSLSLSQRSTKKTRPKNREKNR
jgi:hypothetical protein